MRRMLSVALVVLVGSSILAPGWATPASAQTILEPPGPLLPGYKERVLFEQALEAGTPPVFVRVKGYSERRGDEYYSLLVQVQDTTKVIRVSRPHLLSFFDQFFDFDHSITLPGSQVDGGRIRISARYRPTLVVCALEVDGACLASYPWRPEENYATAPEARETVLIIEAAGHFVTIPALGQLAAVLPDTGDDG